MKHKNYFGAKHRFVRAVNTVLRPHALHLPTEERKWANSRNMEEKYKLPGFFAGVDGTFLVFDGTPKYVTCYSQYFSTVVLSCYCQKVPDIYFD